jgi:hypothetical protein
MINMIVDRGAQAGSDCQVDWSNEIARQSQA